MRTLEEVTKEIEVVAQVAGKELDSLHWATRGAWATKIETAKQQLPVLQAEYKTTLLRNAVAIFVDGSDEKQAQFATLVTNTGEGVAAYADALYQRLTLEVEATMGHTREWGVGQTAKLHSALMAVMFDLKLSEIPMPSVRDVGRKLKTHEDVFNHIRSIVRAACGDQLNALYLETEVSRRAREIRYTHTTVPVVVLGALPDEVQVLGASYAKGYATVSLKDDEEVNEDLLKKVFKDVNKKIRAKK